MSGPEEAHDTIKELQAQLDSALDVEQKVDIMNALAWQLRHSDLSRAVALAEAAAELASQDGREPYQAGLADSHYHLGDFNIRLGRPGMIPVGAQTSCITSETPGHAWETTLMPCTTSFGCGGYTAKWASRQRKPRF
jgi:hypothetical protein